MKYILLFIALLFASPAWAAITVQGTASSAGAAAATSVTFAHDSGTSGSNCITAVGIAWRNTGAATSISSITFNGVALTEKTSLSSTGNPGATHGALWYILAPARTSANVVVTFSESTNGAAGAQTYCGVNQSTPFGTATTRSSTGDPDTSSSVDVSSASGELVIDLLSRNFGNEAVTVGASQTQEYSQDTTETTNQDRRAASSREAGATTTTMSWTWTTGSSVVHIAIPLKPTAPASAPTFDAVSLGTANNSDTVSTSHTLGGACTNPYAVVNASFELGTVGSVSTVTYGGTGLTFIRGSTNFGRRIEKWGVANPPAGAQTVTATLSAVHNSLTMTTRTYCGVDQTAALGTPVSSSISGVTPTVNVSSATDELIVDGVMDAGTGEPFTVGAGQTQRSQHAQDSANHTQGTSDEAGGTTVTMSWTLSSSDYWAIVAVPLKPVSAGGAQPSVSVIVVE